MIPKYFPRSTRGTMSATTISVLMQTISTEMSRCAMHEGLHCKNATTPNTLNCCSTQLKQHNHHGIVFYLLRPAISRFILFAAPQTADPAAKMTMTIITRTRRPKISLSDPKAGKNAVALNPYALPTQTKSLPWSAAIIVGRTVPTDAFMRTGISIKRVQSH